MRVSNLWFFTKESLYTIKDNWIITLAGITMTFMTMFLLSLSIMFQATMNRVSAEMAKSAEITVYLGRENTPEMSEEVKQQIQGLPGVKEIEFVSSEQALQELEESLGKKKMVLDTVKRNPIPASFRVRLEEANQAEALAESIAQIPNVFDIVWARESLGNLMSLSGMLRSVGFILAFGMAIGTFIIMTIAIMVSINSRKNEVRVMMLEGASPQLVRYPWILEGVLYGLLGSIPAVVAANLVYGLMVKKIEGVMMFFEHPYSSAGIQAAYIIVILCGILFGIGGSLIAIRRELNKYLLTVTDTKEGKARFTEDWEPDKNKQYE